MWGPSGPEGEAQGPAKAVDKSESALNNGVQAGGLFGGLIEDEGDEEEEEEEAAPASVAVDYAAAEKAAAAKKKKESVDDDLANLMADMEAVEKKRCVYGRGRVCRRMFLLCLVVSWCVPAMQEACEVASHALFGAGRSKQPRSAHARTPSRRRSKHTESVRAGRLAPAPCVEALSSEAKEIRLARGRCCPD